MLLVYLACSMTLPLLISLWSRDGAQFELAFSAIIILTIGLFLRNVAGRDALYELGGNESIWMTMAIWMVVPMCGTLPYIFTGSVDSFTDAVFESFSGFTTTGSSIMAHPEELPEGLLVYRSFTQWIGGLGLLLFVVALLRKLNVGAGELYRAEFSGTQQRKLHPRLARSVSRMWSIYLTLTLTMAVALFFTGTPIGDAICLAFSTVSTGGFVTHSGGLALLSQGSIIITTAFMFLSGINVALLFRFFTFRWRGLAKDEELHCYVVLFVVVVAVCSIALTLAGNPPHAAVTYSIFHIASTISTCGFYLPRLPQWPFLASVVTFVLIITGASAGSTGGGIKLRRIIILFKYIRNYITRILHPGAVFRVKVNHEVVEHDYINKIFAFVTLYICSIIAGAFLLTFCGCTIPDAVCMAAANISNLGPSPLINNMGGDISYAALPSVGKWTLTVLMLAGRLELFALIAIFMPAYWKHN